MPEIPERKHVGALSARFSAVQTGSVCAVRAEGFDGKKETS